MYSTLAVALVITGFVATMFYLLFEDMQQLMQSVNKLLQRAGVTMYTVEQIQALQQRMAGEISAVSTRMGNLVQQVSDLSAQVASGGVATQAQLDSIGTALQGEVNALDALTPDSSVSGDNPPVPSTNV